jgi:exodeoxyribonuclease VII large subunit
MPESHPLSVSDLAEVLKAQVGDLGTLEVMGEVTGYKLYASSGHHYFSLKDAESTVACVLYAFQARKVDVRLEDGMRLVLRAKADFYGRMGKLSLIVESARPEGQGDLFRKFKELEARLKAEGLFDEDRKRTLPEFPRTVAFVTSPSGAVWHDFIEVLRTRGWTGSAWLVPAKVQGVGSPESVIRGIERAARIPGIDLIVFGRGGGSMEDLWGFNDEALVRAVAACPVPIISAVGHQTDFTLGDFAADRRAETPTAAAEIIASGRTRLRELLRLLASRLNGCSPQARLRELHQDLDLLRERLGGAVDACLADLRSQLASLASDLQRLSPGTRLGVARERLVQLRKRLSAAGFDSVLARGFVIVRDAEGKVIDASTGVSRGKKLRLHFRDGEAAATGD